jgi:hypothetical protein
VISPSLMPWRGPDHSARATLIFPFAYRHFITRMTHTAMPFDVTR